MATPILSQPQTITQFDLARYASLTAQIDTLKAEQSALQQQLMTALGSGATTEPGARSASLKTCERRSVSWPPEISPADRRKHKDRDPSDERG